MTNASALGIRGRGPATRSRHFRMGSGRTWDASMGNVCQLKVESTTMNRTPVNVPIGTVEITGDKATTKNSINIPAVAPDSRPRAPFTDILIVDWPTMAPNKPETAFATPCATHSWFERKTDGSVSVISSQAWSVMTDSIKPTKVREMPYWKMTPHSPLPLLGTWGRW